MAFADELEENVSQRYALVRVETARHVTAGMSVYSGSVRRYQFGFPIVVADVKRNGSSLTRVTALADVNSSGEYYVDEEEGDVYIYPVGSYDADDDHYIVFQYLFFTSHEAGVVAYETPTDSSTSPRLWEPRLIDEPEVSSNVSDVFVGIFTISETSITVTNTDRALFRYAGPNDSFNDKAVDAWLSVGGELEKIYRGRVNSLRFDVGQMSLSFYDDFSRLLQPAYMGDEAGEALFLKEASSFPDVYPNDHGKAVPYVVGKSRHAYMFTTNQGSLNWTYVVEGAGFAGYDGVYRLDPERATPAVCVSFSSSVIASANRTWGICRLKGDFKTLDFGSPTGSVINCKKNSLGLNSGDEYYALYPSDDSAGLSTRTSWVLNYSGTPDGNLEVGDSFIWDNGVTQYYLLVTKVEANAYRGFIANDTPPTSTFTLAIADAQTNQAPALAIVDSNSGQTYYPVYGLDFTYAITTTSGGNKYMEVTFENSFETASTSGERNHSNMTTLHPSTHQVMFRVSQETSSNETRHDNVLIDILEAAGLTCDATSFDSAGDDLPVNCSFQIPNFDEELQSYLKYAQDILKSTLGFCSLAEDDEVVYRLLEAPATSATTTDDGVYVNFEVEIDYKDVTTELIAYNPHRPIDSDVDTTSDRLVSDRARYLHGVENRTMFRHVLEDITTRLPTILAVMAERRAIYKFRTATRYLGSSVGDDVTVSSDDLLGEVTTADLKIIGISKSTADVTIEATDVEGI